MLPVKIINSCPPKGSRMRSTVKIVIAVFILSSLLVNCKRINVPQTRQSPNGKNNRILTEHVNMKMIDEEIMNTSMELQTETNENNPCNDTLPGPMMVEVEIEVNFVPGRMNSSQRILFQSQLLQFLQEKINLTSSHEVTLVDVNIIGEALTQAEDGMFVLEEDGLFTLLAEIGIHGQVRGETQLDEHKFIDLTLEIFEKHEEFLARDVHRLADKDTFFDHIYEISIAKPNLNIDTPSNQPIEINIDESVEDSVESVRSSQSHEQNDFVGNKNPKMVHLIAYAAIGVGSFGSLGIILCAVYYFK